MNSPNIRELQKQLGQLNLLVEETRQQEKQAILAEIGEHVKAYGITEIELLRAAGFIQATRKKAPAKYYDPDTGQSWSGKGARPRWLVNKNLDDYLIREAPQPWWPERT
ncbi:MULTISPECIES: H-NS histone family protein [Burkholderia]|jgi:DNA-binding protein H-NS|uniref:H-NS histone family protein n=2 Tax=Burkholderia contaminans TaxID=488447 RepID=A0A1E3FYL4_9BURK|nr:MULTISPECIES: H-NS histone family protein [Burkholderia]UTP23379.1 H-NS histone family protein [Burkholderia sp. FXe9]KKL44119.1 histone [Burkholderia contaminans LMG 23361]MBA9832078.1 H-NS histone family protein [Burkholderia contaminans]MBA9839350.1 H-NS histone family protein [Burkholderia contaminans]MBA9864823.1 H-NS histone family protein [Burkholderia contaminans]